MKRSLSVLTLSSLLWGLTAIPSFADDEVTCGEWYDVPDSSMDILVEICEYGIMQGMSEDYYGFNHKLTRTQAAVIGNRLIAGTQNYDSWGDSYVGYSTRLYNEISDYYSDTPEDEYSNEWMLKAMFYASEVSTHLYATPYGFMTGDGDGDYPRSFRPNDEVTIPEIYKVLYESAEEADILSKNRSFSYEGADWYEDLLNYLEDEGAITSVDMEDQDVYLGLPISKHYEDFTAGIYREHAAQFLYYMIDSGLIDADALTLHNELVAQEDEPDFAIVDAYIDGNELYVDVTNNGTTDEDGVTVKLRVETEDGDYRTTTSSNITGDETITFGPYELPENEDPLYLTLDPDDDWSEDNEDDNEYTFDDY